MSLNKNACDSQNRMVLDKLNKKVPEHTKTTNSVQNNSEKPHADRTNNGLKANKDSYRHE